MNTTMCHGKGCTAIKHCQRYNALVESTDDYFIEEPFEVHGKLLTCDMYIANKEAPDTTVMFG